MTSPLLTLNHLLILAKDIHDELGTPAANAAFEDELEGAIAYNENLMTRRLTDLDHFFQLTQFLESKVQKDLKAKGWKEALTITRQQLNSLKKEFATNPLMGKPMVMPTLVQPSFNLAEAHKRAAELATELSALLKQIAAHS